MHDIDLFSATKARSRCSRGGNEFDSGADLYSLKRPSAPMSEIYVLAMFLATPSMLDISKEKCKESQEQILISVRAEWFSSKNMEMLYRSIVESWAEGKKDIVDVLERLESKGINKIDGQNLIKQIQYSAVSELLAFGFDVNPECHIDKMKDAYYLRQIQSMCSSVAYQISEDTSPEKVAVQVGQISKMVQDLITKNDGQDVEPLKSVVKNTIVDLHSTDDIAGIPTGFTIIDESLGGLQKGTLVILGGRPSVGKSILAYSFLENAARVGHPSLLFSVEMTRKQLGERFLSKSLEKHVRDIRIRGLEEHEITQVYTECDIPLYCDFRSVHVEDIARVSHICKRKYGIQVIAVDYFQILRTRKVANQLYQTEAYKEISNQLKQLAKELDVCVILVSQLRREAEDVRRGGRRSESRYPQLSDLKNTGALEQDADIVLFLHRDYVLTGDEVGYVPDGKLILAKGRNEGTAIMDIFLPSDFEIRER